MYKIAAVGDFYEVAHFAAIGAKTFFPKTESDCKRILEELSNGEYAIVFVSGRYDGCIKNNENVLPAIVKIENRREQQNA